MIVERGDGFLELESYVLPNQVIADEIPLTNFRVPLESVERAAGFQIAEKLPKDRLKRINGK